MGTPERALRALSVFLCHSSSDKPIVRELFRRLRLDGLDPWLDEEKLLPGQPWAEQIEEAVRKSDVVVICLSNNAVTREGFVQKEIRQAIDVAEEKPEDTIFLIPLRLEACNVPRRLSHLQWVDHFEHLGYERLLNALELRAKSLGRVFGDRYRNMSQSDFCKVQIATIAEALYKDSREDLIDLIFCCARCGSPRVLKPYVRRPVSETRHTLPGYESFAYCLDCDWGYEFSPDISWGQDKQTVDGVLHKKVARRSPPSL
jgi:hypothetical protein